MLTIHTRIFALTVFCAGGAAAQTIEEKRQFCSSSGEVAAAATAARDAGIPLTDVHTMVQESFNQPQALAFFRALTSLVFAMDGVDTSTARSVAEQMCKKQFGIS